VLREYQKLLCREVFQGKSELILLAVLLLNLLYWLPVLVLGDEAMFSFLRRVVVGDFYCVERMW
jgi:hypothetical protein